MSPRKRLQNRIRETRKRRGLRQSDLAERAGITRQSVIAIEAGRLNPSVALALRLAEVLEEPVGELFYLAAAGTAGDGPSVEPLFEVVARPDAEAFRMGPACDEPTEEDDGPEPGAGLFAP